MDSASEQRQLILLSAGISRRRRALGEHGHALLNNIDWIGLSQTLMLRRLLPTLGPRIVQMADGRSSEGFDEAVLASTSAARRQGVFLQLMTDHVRGALTDAGIRSAPLKGPFLSEALYGDLGRRLASDIDMLVAPEELSAAVDVVRSLGYSPPTDYVDRDHLPLLHFALTHERGELPPVELHWRIHWYERAFARDCLLPPDTTSQACWHVAPISELLALLLFYARDGFVDLRLATDLGAWWDHHGGGVQPGELDELLRSYPSLKRSAVTAVEVAGRVVGIPVDQLIEERVDLRGRMAVRLANPNPKSGSSQLHADVGLIDGLLMPSGGFGEFWSRQVMLPREALEDRMRHGTLPSRSRAGHAMRVLARYGLAAARFAQPVETLNMTK